MLIQGHDIWLNIILVVMIPCSILYFPNEEVCWHQHIKKTILNDANENEETMRDIPFFRSLEQIFEGECECNFFFKLLSIYFL